ncbi:biopolymer transporter ExbD [Flagellimonas aquimarina]|uniref:Biopolymer transporter ExbD n=1 Tax=Flagellimonas aquimarina TaxID=2201895 RepID=A0A316KZS3_9FLAO|nr:biopolymer transporter ExbD [Allomuricauda koreensis]PWL39354.1 biopolymer transporter ExbD [Allomuricauda koreensis]
MARNNEIPEVNAGSMADIAFLLLIFFLVTTTIETDVGLDRKLPPKDPTPPIKVQEKNIFRVSLNKKNELLVENEIMSLENLKSATIDFLDNGGAPKGDGNYCDYCQGDRSLYASDSPGRAIVSLNSDREATYGVYILVQNELTAAYNELRSREAERLFNLGYEEMEEIYFDPQTDLKAKSELKAKINQIRTMYPMQLSEAETNMNLIAEFQ